MSGDRDENQEDRPGETEIGVVGGDLLFWRAREAMRHGEKRLEVQSQAMQALEGRATSMMSWCVTGGLALGAAMAGGVHVRAAGAVTAPLLAAAALCLWGVLARDWTGPGYQPKVLLEDKSRSEYEALVELAKGYQTAVERNRDNFRLFQMRLSVAAGLIFAAPLAGAVVLIIPALHRGF